MAVEQIKVHELVERAVSHRWSVPEFQRGFVWKATQVRDLAESLWRNYPIGSLLLWNSNLRQEERVAKDGVAPRAWIVDGQQRTTALAILFNRKPYWWASADEWNKTLRRYDIRFDVAANDGPFFLVANAAIRRAKGDRYVPLCRLVTLDTEREPDRKALTELAKAIKLQGLCDGMDAMDVYARLDHVRKIRSKDVITVTVDHELEEVVEIFSRLNSRGTRVTEADIYLGIVASHNPGWVRDEFLPFLNVLEDFGFRLDPNLLFRSLTAIGAGRVRFKDITDTFWSAKGIIPAWDRCKAAWRRVVRNLGEFGVLSDDPLPTKAALVTLAALSDKFPDEKSFHPAMLWFVQASRYGRYSGSAATSSEEDLRDIKESPTRDDAVARLLKRFREEPFSAEDFRRDYTDGRFFTFLLYLMVFENKATDWDKNGLRLGFDGRELVADFRPQWHHVFPVKLLKGKYDEAEIDQLANIAVIGPTINIRISAQSPMKYFDKYQILDEKLRQQFIDPDIRSARPEDFGKFATERAEGLAAAANSYLAALREGARA
ncbi:MAG: GmrSD restriction endonuclease domain-containing protein [Candidatus Limnocylindria bacterium]